MSSLTARKPAPDEVWLRAHGGAPSTTPAEGAAPTSLAPRTPDRTSSSMPAVQPPGNLMRPGETTTAPFCPPATTTTTTTGPDGTTGGAPWGPNPPAWVDDRTTERCMSRACDNSFDGIVERRHHCRLCGKVVCQNCSSRNAMLPPEWRIKEPQRVCNDCFRVVLPFQATWVKSNANAERENFLQDDDTTKYLNSPLRFTLGGEIRKAAYTIQNLTDPQNVNFWERDVEYTTELLEAVEGLLFMTVGKIAFIGGVRIATGCLIAKLDDGSWSAPCAVGSFGITFGACVGAEITDMVTGIDKESMVKFANNDVSNIMLGGEASFALGPFGRTASGEVHVAAAGPADHTEAYMSYSQSRGAFGGVTVEAAYVKVRDDVNEKFYGYAVKPLHILDGTVPRPKAAAPLYAALADFYAQVFPHGGPRPTTPALENGGTTASSSSSSPGNHNTTHHPVVLNGSTTTTPPGTLQSKTPTSRVTEPPAQRQATTTASAQPVVYGARRAAIPPLGAGVYSKPERSTTKPPPKEYARSNPFGHFNKEDASGVLAHQARVEAARLKAAQLQDETKEEVFDLFPTSPSDDPLEETPPAAGTTASTPRTASAASSKAAPPVTVTVVSVGSAASATTNKSGDTPTPQKVAEPAAEKEAPAPAPVVVVPASPPQKKPQNGALSPADDEAFFEPRKQPAAAATDDDDDDDLFGEGRGGAPVAASVAPEQPPKGAQEMAVTPPPVDDDDDLFGAQEPPSNSVAQDDDDLFGEETAAL